MIFLILLCSLLILYATTQTNFYLKRRKLLEQSWGDLLNVIQPVNTKAIAEIAECYLRPSSSQLRVDPVTMWREIGGVAGLNALQTNAQAMLDLAIYAAQWNRVEGRIVSEMMRRDGVRLKRAIRKIELAMVNRALEKYAAFELQEAAAAYQLMHLRLLGLYEVAHIGLHGRLAQRLSTELAS